MAVAANILFLHCRCFESSDTALQLRVELSPKVGDGLIFQAAVAV
jgi:hypothetical protein